MNSAESLWDRVYAIQAVPPSEDVSAQLSTLLSDVNSAPAEDSDKALLRGYIAYHFCCQETQSIDIETELKHALEIDPTNTTARLYLGHWYFDCGRYSDATRELGEIDTDEYAHVGQQWRAVKVRELLLSARLYCGQLDAGFEGVEPLLKEFRNASPDNLAVPTEIILALLSHRDLLVERYGFEHMRRLAGELREITDAIAGPESLLEEISALVSQN